MSRTLQPVPDGKIRADIAERIRNEAAKISRGRASNPPQKANGDLATAFGATEEKVSAVGTFTKGLVHDAEGRVTKINLEGFIKAFNQAHPNPAQNVQSPFPLVYSSGKPAEFNAPLYDPKGDGAYTHPIVRGVRGWESPISGHTFDLQGCDADATGMPPAPEVGSAELTAEMAEVYWAAIIRDKPFNKWDSDRKVQDCVGELIGLPFFASDDGLDDTAKKRKVARLSKGELTTGTVFRGSTPGAMAGPYISQFMLIGSAERPDASTAGFVNVGALPRAAKYGTETFDADGKKKGPLTPSDGVIVYGSQGIPQKQTPHREKVDHMTSWSTWLDVQNGANMRDVADEFEDNSRFIHTPRDLATYVHYDALYQAYLNAVLILSGMGADTDIGLPEGGNTLQKSRDAFATFGGPHILALVTEVSTRALKAVRRQKFNIHLRARPEAVAGSISKAWTGGAAADSLGPFKHACEKMSRDLAVTLKEVAKHNMGQNGEPHAVAGTDLGPLKEATNGLLPMAFPEGSPMHGSYGAGHATVAGACVTVVKAFFEMFEIGETKRGERSIHEFFADKKNRYPGRCPEDLFKTEKLLTDKSHSEDEPFKYNPLKTAFVTNTDGSELEAWDKENLSIQGELDKLAANISIGRNFAGVHYYTDYYESLRMGERVAVSMLQEQMLTYREPVSMRFTSFDSDRIMIVGTGGSKGQDDAIVYVWDENGNGGTKRAFETWWNSHR